MSKEEKDKCSYKPSKLEQNISIIISIIGGIIVTLALATGATKKETVWAYVADVFIATLIVYILIISIRETITVFILKEIRKTRLEVIQQLVKNACNKTITSEEASDLLNKTIIEINKKYHSKNKKKSNK